MSSRASVIEFGLQTTRVVPGALASSAEASERALGTLPPAAGVTVVWGRGSGQYEVRSTWASAVAGSTRHSRHDSDRRRTVILTSGGMRRRTLHPNAHVFDFLRRLRLLRCLRLWRLAGLRLAGCGMPLGR